jgi:hypothetical protein
VKVAAAIQFPQPGKALKALMETILFTCRKQDFLLEETNQFFRLIEILIEDNIQR